MPTTHLPKLVWPTIPLHVHERFCTADSACCVLFWSPVFSAPRHGCLTATFRLASNNSRQAPLFNNSNRLITWVLGSIHPKIRGTTSTLSPLALRLWCSFPPGQRAWRSCRPFMNLGMDFMTQALSSNSSTRFTSSKFAKTPLKDSPVALCV